MAKNFAEIILYLVLPEEELKSRPIVLLVTEILINGVILPLVETISSPDYINQMVCWLLENAAKDTEDATVNLIHAAKDSRSLGELEGILDAMESECAQLRSNDTCGPESIEHQELILLEELLKIVSESCKKIKKGGRFATNENNETKTDNLYDLSIDVALENKLALDKFREYLKTMQLEQYLLFWLHVENFRTSAEKLKIDRPNRANSISSGRFSGIFRTKTQYNIQTDTLRTIACSIYDEYLHSSARKRLDLDEALVNKLKHELSQDNISIKSTLFDELQHKCLHVMTTDVMMYPGFRKSENYLELLRDLDLVGLSSEEPSLREETTRISAQLIDVNITKESGSSHAAFQISVTRLAGTDDSESYSIFRRFSDFHDLDLRLREMLPDADYKKMNLQLPNKTLFRKRYRIYYLT
ncbi:Oidioi.mRNA.OKI2018_I69.chr1.g2154.t1.cds [Oikopleura dioica]|uniref:Oidioi.mRNA.OKI2018_I69.chr1.g2154.t1.cds n=1 Tax=Oikopleura dioica TaxID=34765 RepID=A0ABN7SRX5_OIKDI|nr:Oidioi.mRNA.OKI2018_I69.chr1.g2154.t1.cds [Oikopleura dioica]